jgi:predicted HD phosphohydrolase
MSVERPITGSLRLPISALPAGRTQPQPTCAPLMNQLAVKHARKNFLKDILRSRPYDNSAQSNANRFRRTREEQNAFRL